MSNSWTTPIVIDAARICVKIVNGDWKSGYGVIDL